MAELRTICKLYAGLFVRRRRSWSFRGARKAREPGIQGPERFAMPYNAYLMASKRNGTLYLGVTRDLVRRVHEHRTKATPGFTSRYGVARLVWFECYDDPTTAITREKQIKKWRRAWKLRSIEESNPQWRDLYGEIAG